MKQLQGILTTLLLLALISTVTANGAGAEQAIRGEHGVHPHPLPKATRLYAEQQGDAILLQWRAVERCDGYRVYHDRGDELKPGALSFDVDDSQTSSLFLDVIPGESYSFRVCALFGKREGPLSPRVTVLMKDKTTAVLSDTAK